MVVLIATVSACELASLRRALGADVEVRWAQSCAETLRQLRRGPVSVVLCDAEMPDGNWRMVLTHAETRPVIVFSRFADEELWSEVLHFGAYDLLLLPFHTEEVRRVTAAAARSRSEGGAMDARMPVANRR